MSTKAKIQEEVQEEVTEKKTSKTKEKTAVTDQDQYDLVVQGKPTRIYKVSIEGKEQEVLTDDKITVKTRKEFDYLRTTSDLNGGFLFKPVGGNE